MICRSWDEGCFPKGHLYYGNDISSDHYCSDYTCSYIGYEDDEYYQSSKEKLNRVREPLKGVITLRNEHGQIIQAVIHDLIGSGTGSLAYLVNVDGERRVLKQLFPEMLCNEYLIDGASSGLIVRNTFYAKHMWKRRKKAFLKAAHLQIELSQVIQLKDYVQPLMGIYTNKDTVCTLTKSFVGYSWDKHNDYSIRVLLRIIAEITRLVQYINDLGFLVVDIKPSNFAVSVGPSETVDVRLIDFGGIKRINSRGRYMFSTETCPKEYKSSNHKEIGTWSEVYSIVAMLVDRIFGHHQLKRMECDILALCKPKYHDWVYKHKEPFKQFVFHGLSEDHSTRIQNCHELMDYLIFFEEN